MSEAETRRQQAAELKAFIMEKVEGAETGRDAEYVREIARSLSTIADPSTMSDSVREGVLYPPGDLAVEPHAGRLASGRRRIESNSALIREMASGRFTPMLVNRDTGEPVSAIDARWWPEYGNREELEAKIGAIVSSLDAAVAAMSTLPVFHPHVPSAYGTARSLLMLFQSLQITLRNRGLGAMSFDQMMFNDEDLATPQPEEWPDMIAQSPGQVIQAMRLALTNNTVARLSREDLRLPAGFSMERRLPQMRQSDEDPVQSLLGPANDWNYTTIERSSDQRLGQFQESLSHMLQTAVAK